MRAGFDGAFSNKARLVHIVPGGEERSRSELWRARGASLISQRPGRHLIPVVEQRHYAACASPSGDHAAAPALQ